MAPRPRVAIVHDWLTVYGGAERVLDQMLRALPEAELFALVDFMPKHLRGFLRGKPVTTSFIQRLPLARKHFRKYLPLFPVAIEQLDLSGFDVVVSSSFSVAKGVLTGPDQVHISMCYSPMRYAWDMQADYLREAGLDKGISGAMARYWLHRLRLWDAVSAQRVDHFIAISGFVAERIRKYYGRESAVIFPPAAVDAFGAPEPKGDHYMTASRLVAYKKVPAIVEAFRRMPQRKLVVIGDGPETARVAAAAQGASNIEVMGHVAHERLQSTMARAKAFVYAAKEDFGIVLVEAQASGTPVIALGRGGARDIVRPLGAAGPTGVLFDEATPEAIVAAVETFETNAAHFTPNACRLNAARFSEARFQAEFRSFLFEKAGTGDGETERAAPQLRL